VERGVKYILRTELIFERVDSPLTPRSISTEEEMAWARIVSLYELSEVGFAVFSFLRKELQANPCLRLIRDLL
jgi:hypothetical protein